MANSASKELYNGLFGQGNNGYLTSTDGLVTLQCKAIQALSDTVFTTLTESDCYSDIGSNTLTAGIMIYGKFTSVQLTSGLIKYYE